MESYWLESRAPVKRLPLTTASERFVLDDAAKFVNTLNRMPSIHVKTFNHPNQSEVHETLPSIDSPSSLVTADFYFKVLSASDTTLTLTGQIVATRTISTGGGTFESWLAAGFPGAVDPNVVGPGADADKDGIPNLVEFAFGLNPANRDSAFAPLKASLASATPGIRVLEFIRPKGLTGVSYQLLVSDDLRTWTVLSATPEITDLGGGQEKVVVRDTASLASNRGRFVLLAVSKS